jgi:hypothetical protein
MAHDKAKRHRTHSELLGQTLADIADVRVAKHGAFF